MRQLCLGQRHQAAGGGQVRRRINVPRGNPATIGAKVNEGNSLTTRLFQKKQDTVIAFVHLEKAFDSAECNKMFYNFRDTLTYEHRNKISTSDIRRRDRRGNGG